MTKKAFSIAFIFWQQPLVSFPLDYSTEVQGAITLVLGGMVVVELTNSVKLQNSWLKKVPSKRCKHHIFTSRAAAESYSAFRWTCWEGDVCLLINSLDLLGRGRLSIFLPYFLIFTFDFWFNMLERVFWVCLDMDNILYKCLLSKESFG